jgi:hypothetical protein
MAVKIRRRPMRPLDLAGNLIFNKTIYRRLCNHLSEADTLGHTSVKATFYNALNYIQYLEGKLKLDDVKKAEVEALVDTGATFPALPEEIIALLALPSLGEHPAETAEGAGKVELVANAIIKIEDRIAQSPSSRD